MTTRRTIVVSGMIAADPWQGGATWAVLQYVLGFRRLGWEVFFVEPIPPAAIRPIGASLEESDNARYFRQVLARFGLQDSATLLLADTRQTFGLSYNRLLEVSRQSGVLLNISGLLRDQELFSHIPVRVYLDLDPAFNQLWSVAQNVDMRYRGHTHFVTIGQRIGEPDCAVPTCGIHWLKTWQPVVLDYWPPAGRIEQDGFTTVANWRGYGSIEHQGVMYGQKAHSLRPLFSLPRRTSEKFMLALGIHPGETRDIQALKENGWQLIDPGCVASTPCSYQRFLQSSKAEFGIAKSGYVASGCGWFSDRSVCYLASGRPVVAQETGFSRHLPTGAGLFAFSSAEEVLQAVEELRLDYPRHSASARAIAVEHFDSDKVLKSLLRKVGMLNNQ